MYYYIFDIKKCKNPAQVEDIKNYLKELGISGEFTYPTAAQTAEELTDLGIKKEYSTIVTIGGDEIANTVATRLVGRREALGIIPIGASPNLSSMVGATSWKEACESLRFRKISEVHMGATTSGNNFLTHVDLNLDDPMEITLEFKDYLVQCKAKDLVVANYYPGVTKIGTDFLDILITSYKEGEGLIKKFSSLFGTKKHEDDTVLKSLFRARSLRIFTKMNTPILLNGTTLAKTPQLIESTDEPLRLITSKRINFFGE